MRTTLIKVGKNDRIVLYTAETNKMNHAVYAEKSIFGSIKHGVLSPSEFIKLKKEMK